MNMKNYFIILMFIVCFTYNAFGEENFDLGFSKDKKAVAKAIQSSDLQWQQRKLRYEQEIKDLSLSVSNLENEIESFKKNKSNNLADEYIYLEAQLKEKVKSLNIFMPEILDENLSFPDYMKLFFQKSESLNEFDYNGRKIILSGFMGGMYKHGNECGFLYSNNGVLSFHEKMFSCADIENKTLVPVCMGNGIKMESDFINMIIDYVSKGGFMIIPIIAAGVIGICLCFIQFFILFYKKIPTKAYEENFLNSLNKDKNFCLNRKEKYPSLNFICILINKAQKETLTKDFIDSFLDKFISDLEKFIPTIGVIAGIAPLLGLLGTITGMIVTFNAAGTAGSAKAAEMALGISQALITTQLGLFIALILMVFHHIFDQRMEKLAFEIEEKKNIFISMERLNGSD